MIEPFSACKFPFNAIEFPWRSVVCAAVETDDLEGIQDGFDSEEPNHHKRFQGTRWHQRYYAGFDDLVEPLYSSFLKWLKGFYGIQSPLVYQKVPSLRIHPPGGKAVGDWHRDSDYGHAEGEANFWLPLTNAWGTNSIWVDGRPQQVRYGEVLAFDGLRLLHGNKINDTGVCRASLDFRLALEGFSPSNKTSVAAGKVLGFDSYYGVLK